MFRIQRPTVRLLRSNVNENQVSNETKSLFIQKFSLRIRTLTGSLSNPGSTFSNYCSDRDNHESKDTLLLLYRFRQVQKQHGGLECCSCLVYVLFAVRPVHN
jgi:hypothetical protein